MRTLIRYTAVAATLAAVSFSPIVAAEPNRPECIAPAQPGGGFDITCRLTQAALRDSKALTKPMRIVYMPGGVGAVAYNSIIGQRPADAGAIVAFSGGSLLNLAQGKFGRYGVDDVRWVAAVGADYGVAVVRDDSPYKDLKSLMEAFRADPSKIVLGAGGSIGSQDWMKAALTARAANVDYKKMRFVAFEGGGEAVTALRGGHIQAYMGDAAEAMTMMEGGAPIRVLAVYHKERLPGRLANVPTATEQGYPIEWPIIRGFYVGPKVSDADYNWWKEAFDKTMATPEFAQTQQKQGLFPFNITGAALDTYVREQVKSYGELARSFELIK
ncbi:tripartite tricarboxylate transporter substrate binding protein [Pigmentiphaga aceris]|uniref:Tripartite tricarboxylate transporter substrate binding protein n=1 Tax=Pigmentiphaga aceris TaxID=1940612 RepID=A0A5C0B5V3_9BURK|nr:tripartite tricarboxylate transporter substrate binding protein [Pigmentiphaga aceris]QEI07937.1 tripartite tricarboxylate transporter substrate binding protein [Pigmentiphaga aceris]